MKNKEQELINRIQELEYNQEKLISSQKELISTIDLLNSQLKIETKSKEIKKNIKINMPKNIDVHNVETLMNKELAINKDIMISNSDINLNKLFSFVFSTLLLLLITSMLYCFVHDTNFVPMKEMGKQLIFSSFFSSFLIKPLSLGMMKGDINRNLYKHQLDDHIVYDKGRFLLKEGSKNFLEKLNNKEISTNLAIEYKD